MMTAEREPSSNPAKSMTMVQGIIKLGKESSFGDKWAGLECYLADAANLGHVLHAAQHADPETQEKALEVIQPLQAKLAGYQALSKPERDKVYDLFSKFKLASKWVALGMVVKQ